ncbi:nucleoside-diphosphate sugar epimerase/dehydratase [Vallitaleaceae bacterium 9-2]
MTLFKRQMRLIVIYIADILMLNLAYIFALWLRFEGQTTGNQFQAYFEVYLEHWLELTLIKLAVFTYLKIYKNLYKYASITEVMNITFAVGVANALAISYLTFFHAALPRSVYIIVAMLDIMLIGGSRMMARVLLKVKSTQHDTQGAVKRILVIGGGDAGAMIIRELKNHSNLRSKPVAIIDDNPLKEGTHINGVPIVGQREDIISVVRKKKIDEIIIAIPSAKRSTIKEIVNECKRTKVKIRIVPGMYELIGGTVNIQSVRDIDIKDILGRDEVNLDNEAIADYLNGKVVMVTGGGGSIGSELSRQIASFGPKALIILDIYENGVFALQNELLKLHPDLGLIIKIASVRDRERIHKIMQELKPEVVFHAAAHKHVPLMEANPQAAVKNNVIGTLNVVQAAHKASAKRFVMISTDKAVNPTNIMGATKRLCEMIIQSMDKVSSTEYVAVRFGNVLGSNGSVVPTFKKQVSEGGPVTVTHKEITRYFMTIPEASQLVLQAGSMAQGGEIFILDMGEPVKIVNLAEDVIRLSGYEPYEDIPIVFTGLRPGEKLYEELLMDEEGIRDTAHDKIHVGQPMDINHQALVTKIREFEASIQAMDDEAIKVKMQEFVPTYKREER